MLRHEIYKIMKNKPVLAAAMVLFILNAAVCLFYTAENAPTVPSEDLSDFISLYQTDPDEVLHEYDDYKRQFDEQEALWVAAAEQGDFTYEQTPVPNRYAKSDAYDDGDLYLELFSRVSAVEDYRAKINSALEQARQNMAEYSSRGYGEDDFIYVKQTKSIARYESALDEVSLKFEYTRGWDSFFQYGGVNLFIFITVLILAAVAFTQETESATSPIIRAAPKGRGHTAGAKILAVFLLTAAAVLLFSLESWLIIGTKSGYSSPANGIQVFDGFTYCPFALTVGEYLAIFVISKIAVSFAAALAVMLFSCHFGGYVPVFAFGICFYGGNFLLSSLRYLNYDNIFLNLNFVSLLSVNPLFADFKVLNLFGRAVEYVPAACVFLTATIAVLTILTFRRYCNKTTVNTKNPAFVGKIKEKYQQIPKLHLPLRYPSSLFAYEIHKTLISTRLIAVVLLLFGIKIYLSADAYQPQNSYSDAVYREYMTTLAGELTEEKLEYLKKERARITETLDSAAEMQEKYAAREITLAEYGDYLSEYNYSRSRSLILAGVEIHAAYIMELQKSNIPAWFVYDTGWNELFFSPFDWTMYLALLLLFAGIFTNEYQSAATPFMSILRSTEKGRSPTWKAKLTVTLVITAAAAILWNIADISFIVNTYELPLSDAPLQSIEEFAKFTSNITIRQYIIMYYLVKITAAVLFSLLLFVLSALLHRHVPVMTTAAVVTAVPAVLIKFGLPGFTWVDFVSLSRASPMLLNLPGTAFYAVAFAVVCAVLAVKSGVKWEDKPKKSTFLRGRKSAKN